MMIRKSGVAGRVVDLRIDAAAREAAAAVRQASNEAATERFLTRYLDHLHELDNAAHGLAPRGNEDPNGSRRRRRRL